MTVKELIEKLQEKFELEERISLEGFNFVNGESYYCDFSAIGYSEESNLPTIFFTEIEEKEE